MIVAQGESVDFGDRNRPHEELRPALALEPVDRGSSSQVAGHRPRGGKSPKTRSGSCASVSALMAEQHDWLQVSLDANSRRGLAEAIETTSEPGAEERAQLLRILRSRRDELLLDRAQGKLVLAALDRNGQLSALRARLEAFLRSS
jgi:hypothetical protein